MLTSYFSRIQSFSLHILALVVIAFQFSINAIISEQHISSQMLIAAV
jgi:hypothetical protein